MKIGDKRTGRRGMSSRAGGAGRTKGFGKAVWIQPGFLVVVFLGALFLLAPHVGWAEKSGTLDLPVSGITPEEYTRLLNREVVIRGLDSHHGIRLNDLNGGDSSGGGVGETAGKGGGEASTVSDHSARFARFLSHFEEVKPNFLYEGMFLLPVSPGEERAVLAEVEEFLLDFDRFEEIPYFSKYNGTTTRLFEYFNFLSETEQADGSKLVVAEQQLKPFEQHTGIAEYRLDEDLFTYVAWNQTPLYYKWVKGVGQEKMYIAMMAKASPGRIFFYGLIGAKANDFFGLFHGRLDLAFSGRAEAVFNWFHKEFVLPRLE
jgi:hypothetical protein